MKDWIAHFREAMRGLKTSHVWRGHGSALFLEFGRLTPATRVRLDGSPGAPTGEIEFMIEWSWRVEGRQSIICGSWSDEAPWQPASDRLLGQEVTDLTTFGRLPEIMLTLSNDLYVASFMTGEGDPEWALFDRRTPVLLTAASRCGVVDISA